MIYFFILSYYRLHLNIPDRINTSKKQTICIKQTKTIQESRSSLTQIVNRAQILPLSVVQLTKIKIWTSQNSYNVNKCFALSEFYIIDLLTF